MRRTIARRLWPLLAVVAAAVTVTVAPPTPAGAAAPVDAPSSGQGITVTGWSQIGWHSASQLRLYEATITTGAIYRQGAHPALRVRILVPANYQTDPAHPYDVLYLLHGGAGTAVDWSGFILGGHAWDIVNASPYQGIVVMPEGGFTGWYSNWYHETDGHFRPDWETFHIEQLVPWIDANFNTDATRAGRAVAGVSMGGFGALKYAAKHADVFSTVGSFSGGTDVTLAGAQDIVADSMQSSGAAIFPGGLLDSGNFVRNIPAGYTEREYRLETVLGPRGVDDAGWKAISPYYLAAAEQYDAYDGRLAMYAGGNDTGEVDMANANDDFHAMLNAHGVTHRYCTGPGDHTWPYFREDFEDFLLFLSGNTPTDPGDCTDRTGWTLRPTVP